MLVFWDPPMVKEHVRALRVILLVSKGNLGGVLER